MDKNHAPKRTPDWYGTCHDCKWRTTDKVQRKNIARSTKHHTDTQKHHTTIRNHRMPDWVEEVTP